MKFVGTRPFFSHSTQCCICGFSVVGVATGVWRGAAVLFPLLQLYRRRSRVRRPDGQMGQELWRSERRLQVSGVTPRSGIKRQQVVARWCDTHISKKRQQELVRHETLREREKNNEEAGTDGQVGPELWRSERRL